MHPSVHPPHFPRQWPPFDRHFLGEKNHRLGSMVRYVLKALHPPNFFFYGSTLIKHMNDPFKSPPKSYSLRSESRIQHTPTPRAHPVPSLHVHFTSVHSTIATSTSSNLRCVQLSLESNHQEPIEKSELSRRQQYE